MIDTTELSDTEKKIHEAAKRVFLRKGLQGARMQEIADEAGINKSLLHYYFRNKEKLFQSIFAEVFKELLPHIAEIFNSDKEFFTKIRVLVKSYIQILIDNPYMPVFILQELHQNPERLSKMIQERGVQPAFFIQQVQTAIDSGLIRPIHPRQLIVNILSLCIFPIAARPLLKTMLFADNDAEYETFLEARKAEVADFVINSIKTQ